MIMRKFLLVYIFLAFNNAERNGDFPSLPKAEKKFLSGNDVMFTWEQIEQLENAGFDTTGFLQETKPTKKPRKRRKNNMFSNVQEVVLM